MKKNFMCFLVFLFVSVFALSAQQKYLDCINNGDYIYFMDYRYNSPYIKGYLVYHFDDTSSFIVCRRFPGCRHRRGSSCY